MWTALLEALICCKATSRFTFARGRPLECLCAVQARCCCCMLSCTEACQCDRQVHDKSFKDMATHLERLETSSRPAGGLSTDFGRLMLKGASYSVHGLLMLMGAA